MNALCLVYVWLLMQVFNIKRISWEFINHNRDAALVEWERQPRKRP